MLGREEKKMRVLEVFGEPISHGGQESFLFSALEKMDKSDLQIDFFTPYYCDNDRYKNFISAEKGRLFVAGLKFEPGGSRHNIIRPLNMILRDTVYDVVHIHSGSISVLNLSAQTAKKANVKKVIVHSHCGGINRDMKYRITRFLNMPGLKLYPDIYCACSEEAGIWKYPASVVKEQLRIIHNGVDVEKFCFNRDTRKSMRKKLGFSEENIVIGHVGRFSEQKNHSFIIKLLEEISKKDNKYRLLLLGDGPLRDAIKEQVSKSNLTDIVTFTGNVDNVNEYLQAMDIFVMPSFYEGFPVVAIEAQATGLPVLCSNNITKEIQVDNLVSFLALDEKEQWLETIVSLANNTKERQSKKELLREYGLDNASVARIIRDMYFE